MNEEALAKYIGTVESQMFNLRQWLLLNRGTSDNHDMILKVFEIRTEIEFAFTEFELNACLVKEGRTPPSEKDGRHQ